MVTRWKNLLTEIRIKNDRIFCQNFIGGKFMKIFIKILGIALLIGGSIFSSFTTVPLADCISIGVAALGLALLIVGTLKKAEKKTWKEYVAVILFAVAGFCCGIAGIVDETFTQIATAVAGVVALVIGLITTSVEKDKKD